MSGRVTELLPCPWCGCDAEVENDFHNRFWVQCANLDCARTDGIEYESLQEAETCWNTRAAPHMREGDAKAVHQWRNGSHDGWRDTQTPEFYRAFEVRTLYESPPKADAVDLEQFREACEAMKREAIKEQIGGLTKCDPGKIARADRLLAIIDSSRSKP